MAKKVTLADIAERIGVSTVAVSKALSGKSGVSEELRSRIKELAEEMGYVSSGAAKRVASETGNIGVIIPEQTYGDTLSFYGRLYEMVVRVLYENQYYGILELLTKEDEKAVTIPKVLQDGKVDGLIFIGQMEEAYVKKMANETNVPVFFLDTYIPFLHFDTVISDGYYGMYQLTNYLIEHGHKKIAYVGSVDATSSIADRYWGYRRAMRENHLEFCEEWEIPDRDENGTIYEKILQGPNEMDAYVCNCDFAAHHVIRNLEDAGYSVPEDVSVVGFDNYLPSGMRNDTITSYTVNIERMAVVCVKSLLKKIKNKKYESGIQIVAGELVEKKTVRDR